SPAAHIEPWVGGAFELFFEPSHPERQSTRGCKFLALQPHQRLVFQWKGPDDFAAFMNVPEPRTQVAVHFLSEGEGTRIHLIHSGWGEGEDWGQARSWHEIAWSDVLEALKRTLEEAYELQGGDEDSGYEQMDFEF